MSPEPSIPPLRDLPPGRLATHRTHLLAEIGREPRRRGGRPAIAGTSLRVAAVAAASATAAAGIAVAVAMTGGNASDGPASRPVAAPPLVYVSHVSPPRRGMYFGSDSLTPAGDTAATGPTLTSNARRGSVRVRVPTLVFVLALRQAAANGDRHPTAVQWLATTRQLAVSSQSGDHVASPRRPVYFVVVHGRFGGVNAAKGTVLSFTIDRETGLILDFALANRNPDYARLGRPHRFSFGNGTK
jgi:hypothetical protein